jgi:hypothetical protein
MTRPLDFPLPPSDALDLGPSLPMPVYHALERWHPERIGALTLYCSDGRWGEAFDEFCHRRLEVPRYDRWAVPGGPACLAGHPADAPLLQAARVQLDFLVQAHQLEQFILITHFGCAWYSERLHCPAGECLSEQFADIRRAASTLREWYPGLVVSGYLAMRRGEWVSFHELSTVPEDLEQ